MKKHQTFALVVLFSCGLHITANVTRAEDPKSDSLTVLPFTNTSLAFSTKEKRAVLGLDYLFRSGLRASVDASAPLDEDTRTAAFLKENQFASGFSAGLHFGYESVYRALDLTPEDRQFLDLKLCNEVNAAAAQGAPEDSPPATPAATPRGAPAEPGSGAAAPGPEPGKPLDQATIRAAFQEAIAASKQIIADAVKAGLTEEKKKEPKKEIPVCTPEAIVAWGSEHPTRPEWRRYVAALSGRRALAVRLIPEQSDIYYGIGADLSLTYDRASVYKNDLATKPVDVPKYDVQAGARGTIYLSGQLALTLRAGVDVARGFSASKVNRCTELTSTSASITGKSCSDALFLKSEDSAPKGSGYTRLAITYVSLTTLGGGVPGAEFRGGFEQIGQTPRFNFRALGFFSPEVGAFAARFGIGLDLVDVLADDPATSLTRGQLAFTPFVFVGASPTKLDSLVTW